MLKVGDKAPDFSAVDCNGQRISLSDFRGRRVVVFFFPKAFTPGCTIENRAFRDNHELIKSLGADLIGISVDTVQRQCEFAERENLRFTLIGDESKEIGRAYGVLWPILEIDRRITFIVNEHGIVEDVIKHELRVYRHLDDVLAWLRAHPPEPPGAASATASSSPPLSGA